MKGEKEVNSHSVQLNVELDLQVGEDFDNTPHSLYSSPSIDLKILVNQYETPYLSVLVDTDCCTPWFCIFIPYPALAFHNSYLASNRNTSLSAKGALARCGKVDVVSYKSGRGIIQEWTWYSPWHAKTKSNSYSDQLKFVEVQVQSQVGVEFDKK